MAVIETNRANATSMGLIGRLYANTVGLLATWNDARTTRNALSRLSDRELDDIGLSRGDIDRVIARI